MAANNPSGGGGTAKPLSGLPMPVWEYQFPLPPAWFTTVQPVRPVSKLPLMRRDAASTGLAAVDSASVNRANRMIDLMFLLSWGWYRSTEISRAVPPDVARHHRGWQADRRIQSDGRA